MGYQVIRAFVDLTDDGYFYSVGDSFPREGFTPTEKRILELLNNKNKANAPVIKESENPDIDTEEDSEM